MELFADEHIIKRVLNGDHDAYGHLVNKHKDFVYALCIKMVHNPDDAEEIAQDAFVKAFKQLKTFKGKSKFTTWLYRITYFSCINHLRKNKLETKTLEEWEHPLSDKDTTLSMLSNEERSKILSHALRSLKPQERALITLFYLEEQSIEEIAAITKLTISNTKVKIHRTRKKLKVILGEHLKGEELDLLYA